MLVFLHSADTHKWHCDSATWSAHALSWIYEEHARMHAYYGKDVHIVYMERLPLERLDYLE